MSAISMNVPPPSRIVLALGVLLVSAIASASALAHGPKDAKPSPGHAQVERVDLNSAGVEELCTLPGIGPKKAEAIIAFREKRRFTRVTQLLLVRGIGAKTLQRLRPLIYVGPSVTLGPPAISRAAPAVPPQSPGG